MFFLNSKEICKMKNNLTATIVVDFSEHWLLECSSFGISWECLESCELSKGGDLSHFSLFYGLSWVCKGKNKIFVGSYWIEIGFRKLIEIIEHLRLFPSSKRSSEIILSTSPFQNFFVSLIQNYLEPLIKKYLFQEFKNDIFWSDFYAFAVSN
jgi:hypothetical protein